MIAGYPRSRTTFAQVLLTHFNFYALNEFYFFNKNNAAVLDQLFSLLDNYFKMELRDINDISERRNGYDVVRSNIRTRSGSLKTGYFGNIKKAEVKNHIEG